MEPDFDPLGTNWGYTTCELDENILHNLNGSGVAGLRVSRDSAIFDRNLAAGVINNSHSLGFACGTKQDEAPDAEELDHLRCNEIG